MTTGVLGFGKTVGGPWLSPPESPRMDSDPMYGNESWNAFEEQSLLPFTDGDSHLYYGANGRYQSTHQPSFGGQSLNPALQVGHNVSTSNYSPAPTTNVLNESPSTPDHHTERPPLTSAASAPNLTLNSRIQSEEDDLLSSASDEDEPLEVKEESSKSAAERRAERRKMKRFRLTHTQTRFLMSEFTRQAHPDAAQRDRLSREIPGLSPRQVQVWFQNRRAKLKRLTADDQERMLKSRALPDGFNSTQALHYPHDTASHMNVETYPQFQHINHHSYDISRSTTTPRVNSISENTGIISPISVSSSMRQLYLNSDSGSASQNLSPVSPPSEHSHFYTAPPSQDTSPRACAPTARSHSFPMIYPIPIHPFSIPGQEGLVRSRDGSSAFPSSTAYPSPLGKYNSAAPVRHRRPRRSSLNPQQRLNLNRSMVVRGGSSLGTLHSRQGIRLDMTNVQPEVWPNPNNFTEYSPTDVSAATSIVSHPGYRSTNALTGTQDVHAQPTQCSQSAPLAAPPEFQSPQWHMSYQAAHFDVATGPTYGEGQQTNPVWLPDQVAQPYSTRPYQANVYTGSFHPPLMIDEDQSDIPLNAEPTENWLRWRNC